MFQDGISLDVGIQLPCQHNGHVPQTRLILVDDDNFARTALSGALSGAGYEVKSFRSAADALNFESNAQSSIAILDLDLGPGPSGLDLAHILRRKNPQLGLIFVTSYTDPRLLGTTSETMPPGSRYIVKSQLDDLNHLLKIIEQTKVSPLRTSRKTPTPGTKLSRNQIQILRLVAGGKSTRDIADYMDISIKSVESTISRINAYLDGEDEDQNKRVRLAKLYYKLIGKI